MRLTTKGQYAVRLMLDLALHDGEKPVSARDISEREGISLDYIEQLCARLRKAGLIKSVRGPVGGYKLAKKSSSISIGDIIRIAEGPIALVYCVNPRETGKSCLRSSSCVTRLLWKRLSDRIAEVLDSITLVNLRNEAKKLRSRTV